MKDKEEYYKNSKLQIWKWLIETETMLDRAKKGRIDAIDVVLDLRDEVKTLKWVKDKLIET